jgi:hypothetical protein
MAQSLNPDKMKTIQSSSGNTIKGGGSHPTD